MSIDNMTEDDRMALGVLAFLEEKGIRLPKQDLSKLIHFESITNAGMVQEFVDGCEGHHIRDIVPQLRSEYNMNVFYDRLLALAKMVDGDQRYQAIREFVGMQRAHGFKLENASLDQVIPGVILPHVGNPHELYPICREHRMQYHPCDCSDCAKTTDGLEKYLASVPLVSICGHSKRKRVSEDIPADVSEAERQEILGRITRSNDHSELRHRHSVIIRQNGEWVEYVHPRQVEMVLGHSCLSHGSCPSCETISYAQMEEDDGNIAEALRLYAKAGDHAKVRELGHKLIASYE